MADYYFDFDNGDDTNSGATPALALKNLCGTPEATGNAIFNPSAGDNLYLARGSAWNMSTAWVWAVTDSGAEGNHVYVGAYDRTGEINQPDPIVENFEIFSSGDWTESGTAGVWYAALTAATDTVARVFLDWAGQASSATSAATCTAAEPWWFDSTGEDLYIYTGSSVNDPNDVYTDVRCVSSGPSTGAFVVDYVSCQYTTFENITFRGSEEVVFNGKMWSLGNPCGPLLLKNCTLSHMGQFGMRFSTVVATNYEKTDIIDCVFDKGWHADENTGASPPATDGIVVRTGIDNNLTISGCEFRNFTHDAVSITAQSATYPIVSGVKVHDCIVTAPDVEYGRAFDCNCTHGTQRAIDCEFVNNLIIDVPTRSQIEGINTLFHNNIIVNSNNFGETVYGDRAQGLMSQARSTAACDGVVISNNIIVGQRDGAYILQDGLTYPITSIRIVNNIFTSPDNSLPFGYNENDTTGDLRIDSNILYSATTDNVIYWAGTFYDAEEANAARDEMTGNIMLPPLLDTDYYPYSTSPVIGAGVWTGSIKLDKGGRPFKRSKPSIGVWEVANRDPVDRNTR